jgi:hypothetical protein
MRHFIDIVVETHAADVKEESTTYVLPDGTLQDGSVVGDNAVDIAAAITHAGWIKVSLWTPVVVCVEWKLPLTVAARNALLQYLEEKMSESFKDYYLDTMRGYQTYNDGIGFINAVRSQAFDQWR